MKALQNAVFVSLLFLAGACSTVRQVSATETQPATGQAALQKGDGVMVYSVAVNIQASPKAVWDILTHAPAYTQWTSTITKLEGEIAQGKKIELVSKTSPDRTFKLKVSELVPEQRMVWEDGMPLGLFAGVRTFTLSPQEDGTTRFTMAEVFSGGMYSMIADSIPDLRPSFEEFAADLKRKAEAVALQ